MTSQRDDDNEFSTEDTEDTTAAISEDTEVAPISEDTTVAPISEDTEAITVDILAAIIEDTVAISQDTTMGNTVHAVSAPDVGEDTTKKGV